MTMTLDLEALARAVERIAELERRIAELEAAGQRQTDALGFTLAEVSERFLPGVPESTLRAWIRSGDLVAHLTPGGRLYLVYMEDLCAFLDRLRARKPEAAERQASVADNVRRILAKQKKAG